MTFGQILQKIRRAKRKTQREVADLIGMDYGYYSRIENDKFDYKPSRETIEKIIEKLDCNDDEKAELLAAAGRIDKEMEELAIKAVERPELRPLFRAVVETPKDEIAELFDLINQHKQEKLKKENQDAED
ncbi:MAG: helix-turn-helix domain-containing protein [Pyrinomonadaceae bacterium]|nr:helix-turn-helix domain-containing protein [Pyrinomonadaceae bacterium]